MEFLSSGFLTVVLICGFILDCGFALIRFLGDTDFVCLGVCGYSGLLLWLLRIL